MSHLNSIKEADQKVLDLVFKPIFDSEKILNSLNQSAKKFYYINNPDGTIRWIFPENLRHPSFLAFYSTATKKAKLMASGIKTAFFLKQKTRIASGQLVVNSGDCFWIEKMVADLGGDNYSIFTGTTGPNRKVIIEVNKNGKTTHFIKIPLSEKSLSLCQHEFATLEKLNMLDLEAMQIPNVVQSRKEFIQSNLKNPNDKRSLKLNTLHFNALSNVYSKTIESQDLNKSSFWEILCKNISYINNDAYFGDLKPMLEILRQHIENQNINAFSMALAHGDFTPWNVYQAKSSLKVYDWELSIEKAPLLFDLFHFMMQTGVLVQKMTWTEIKTSIKTMLNSDAFVKKIEHFLAGDSKKSIDLAFQLYLLYNTAYYINIYQKQELLHEQAFWLKQVWEEALTEQIMNIDNNENQRKDFTKELFDSISHEEYALMKFSERKIEDIADSSDLDILLTDQTEKTIFKKIKNTPEIEKINKAKLSFMTVIELYFNDGSFLRLDLIKQLKRKSLPLVDTLEVLKGAKRTTEGIRVPDICHDFEYIFLFYNLNKAAVPHKYIQFFEEQTEEDQQKIKDYFKQKYSIEFGDIGEWRQFSKSIRTQLLTKLQMNETLLSKLSYFTDTVKGKLFQRGLVMTVSGVDGAGKSTIINEIEKEISETYRKKTVVLRHRPSLLPIISAWRYGKKAAEKKSMESLPRQGGNTNLIASIIRFSYYFIDYVVGQIWVFLRYYCQGYVVIYDRYFFDFINDSKRSNIQLKGKWIQPFYNFIYKPKLNFFLYAQPEVILQRKQELNESTILRLNESYHSLFDNYNKRFVNSEYISIENIEKEKTLATIIDLFRKAI